MNKTRTNPARRAVRAAGKSVRRSAPAVIACLLLAGLVGTLLAGAVLY